MTIVQDSASLKYHGAHFFMADGIIAKVIDEVSEKIWADLAKVVLKYARAKTIINSRLRWAFGTD